MTTFVISHNLQVNSELTPALSGQELASGLVTSSTLLKAGVALTHSHWLMRIESDLTPTEMADELIKAWRNFRVSQGHAVDHAWLALGGRKDTQAIKDSPLQQGCWGVDLVECSNPDVFLESINWDALKSGREVDSVFEVRG